MYILWTVIGQNTGSKMAAMNDEIRIVGRQTFTISLYFDFLSLYKLLLFSEYFFLMSAKVIDVWHHFLFTFRDVRHESIEWLVDSLHGFCRVCFQPLQLCSYIFWNYEYNIKMMIIFVVK